MRRHMLEHFFVSSGTNDPPKGRIRLAGRLTYGDVGVVKLSAKSYGRLYLPFLFSLVAVKVSSSLRLVSIRESFLRPALLFQMFY